VLDANDTPTITSGWSSTGTHSKTWDLVDADITSTGVQVGWCFAAIDTQYTDAGSLAVYHWLWISAVTSSTIDTEWYGQGFDTGNPRGYFAQTGAAQAKVRLTNVFSCPTVLVFTQGVPQSLMPPTAKNKSLSMPMA